MSVSRFPIPQTTQFNPAAWDFSFLDRFAAYFVTFPRTQNDLINFPESPTLTTRTALTQWADTAYATSEIVAWTAANVPALLPVAQTWAILQYYFGGIAVNTINPLTTGGTLLIGHGSPGNTVYIGGKDSRSVVLHLGDGNTSSGGIHINNGTNVTGNVNILDGIGSTGILTLGSSTSTTRLNCPLTPLYTYPVGTATGLNTPSIGTPGTIGFIAATTFNTNQVGEGPAGTGFNVRSVTLTAGNWLIYGFFRMPMNSYISAYSIGFVFGGGNDTARKATQAIGGTAPNLVQGQTTMWVVSPTATTTYSLYVGRAPTFIAFSQIIAIRIS